MASLRQRNRVLNKFEEHDKQYAPETWLGAYIWYRLRDVAASNVFTDVVHALAMRDHCIIDHFWLRACFCNMAICVL